MALKVFQVAANGALAHKLLALLGARVRAIGADGPGPWSDPALKTVP